MYFFPYFLNLGSGEGGITQIIRNIFVQTNDIFDVPVEYQVLNSVEYNEEILIENVQNILMYEKFEILRD